MNRSLLSLIFNVILNLELLAGVADFCLKNM